MMQQATFFPTMHCLYKIQTHEKSTAHKTVRHSFRHSLNRSVTCSLDQWSKHSTPNMWSVSHMLTSVNHFSFDKLGYRLQTAEDEKHICASEAHNHSEGTCHKWRITIFPLMLKGTLHSAGLFSSCNENIRKLGENKKTEKIFSRPK